MNRVALAAAGALALLIAVGVYVGSPFYTANQLRVAARQADKQRLEQLVDFSQVRDHFKAQLNSQVQKSASKSDNLLAGLGAELVSAFSGRIIDRIVTADGVASVIRSGRANRDAARAESEAGDGPAPEEHKLRYSGSYQGLNHFLLTIRDSGDPEKALAFLTLTRNGLFSWRVTQIDLPGLLDKTDTGPARN